MGIAPPPEFFLGYKNPKKNTQFDAKSATIEYVTADVVALHRFSCNKSNLEKIRCESSL